jgi:hypothetical protein
MDNNTVLRPASDGNLTADEELTEFSIGPMVNPLYLITVVPSVSSGDTFKVKAYFLNSSDDTLQMTQSAEYSAAGVYALPLFCDHPDTDHLFVSNDVTKDSTAAGSFGAVVQYLSTSRVS